MPPEIERKLLPSFSSKLQVIEKYDRSACNDLVLVIYPAFSWYAFPSFFCISGWGNFITYTNQLVQTN